VALVTGGSRGIGRAVSLRLAREGARIGVNFVSNEPAAAETVEQVNRLGTEAEAVQADVSDRSAVQAMVDRILERFSRIDLLVNNAGIVLDGDLTSYASDADLERDLDAMWGVNVRGIINCTRAVLPQMRKRRSGSIVNIASIAGFGNISPLRTFYSATKAAVMNLTKRFALELGPDNINVNSVAPGLVRTDLLVQLTPPQELERVIQEFAGRSVLGRIGEPADIAAAVAFLASSEARFVTGQILTVDGGRMDYLSSSG
jgi:3-oxoacyl-[acyl-carrier protein] reductase